jgi:predicted ATPase
LVHALLARSHVMTACRCTDHTCPPRIVLTGGPGAGKTAVLEIMRRALCPHVEVVPEAASVLFRGGFPRGATPALQRAAQRAIFYVQQVCASATCALVLCDRGSVDGLAYWPGPEDLFAGVGTTLASELDRYDTVIHLRTPPIAEGYNHTNPLRLETAAEAAAIDAKIAQAWAQHPRRFEVDAEPDFLDKARRALAIVREQLPTCRRPLDSVHIHAIA